MLVATCTMSGIQHILATYIYNNLENIYNDVRLKALAIEPKCV